jgi:hypothetical protein
VVRKAEMAGGMLRIREGRGGVFVGRREEVILKWKRYGRIDRWEGEGSGQYSSVTTSQKEERLASTRDERSSTQQGGMGSQRAVQHRHRDRRAGRETPSGITWAYEAQKQRKQGSRFSALGITVGVLRH